MIHSQVFLVALKERAGKRLRVAREAIWEVFRGTLPVEFADHGRVALAKHLVALEGVGALRQPKQKALWDRSAEPPLPEWIELSRGESAEERVDYRMVAWPPELRRLVDERRLSPAATRDFLAIKRFLAEGGRERTMVPTRERSLELFADEKRLDIFIRSTVTRRVGVTLDLLRAFQVPVPIAWSPGPVPLAASATGLLILENLHSYDSFRRWNAQSGAYLGVVYGGGNAFAGMLDDLLRIALDVGATQLDYFGDIDPEGLRIPSSAAPRLAAAGIPLVPSMTWYELLLDQGAGLEMSGPEPFADAGVVPWLARSLRPRVTALFRAGHRLPQELIGWDLLRGISGALDVRDRCPAR